MSARDGVLACVREQRHEQAFAVAKSQGAKTASSLQNSKSMLLILQGFEP
jgi:hypothetical protein